MMPGFEGRSHFWCFDIGWEIHPLDLISYSSPFPRFQRFSHHDSWNWKAVPNSQCFHTEWELAHLSPFSYRGRVQHTACFAFFQRRFSRFSLQNQNTHNTCCSFFNTFISSSAGYEVSTFLEALLLESVPITALEEWDPPQTFRSPLCSSLQ